MRVWAAAQGAALRPRTSRRLRALSPAFGTAGFALLTWAAAKVSVPLPFTPVPGTLQTLPVLLAGALLGARAGAASQMAYLAMGVAGLPVFALPGSGPAYLLGPTGGYLLGFIAAAYVTGRVAPWTRRFGFAGALAALFSGSTVLYLCGLTWLTLVLGGDLGAAVRSGLLPFVVFDLSKIVVAAAALTALRRFGLGGGDRWSMGTPS